MIYIYKGTHFSNAQDLANWIQLEDLGYCDSKTSFHHVYSRYGRNYLKKFKEEKKTKRKVIEYPTPNFENLKKRNVKFHYKCLKCGRDVYTTWFIINHFKDNLCKHCRKTLI